MKQTAGHSGNTKINSEILILWDRCDILSEKRLIGVAEQGNTIVYGKPYAYNNPFEPNDNWRIAASTINNRSIGSWK